MHAKDQVVGILSACYIAVICLALASTFTINEMMVMLNTYLSIMSQNGRIIHVIGITALMASAVLRFTHDSKIRLLRASGE